ncbi:hypothetical protein Poly41_60150 [Novipirellula artificiosorum]|uniref:Uncharacterized protein n=1 Tax=Novipirellula artificiosorum TaxID=2528016 RepID=A0A5C6D4N3_9BACT|nr:hypothetical protein Poly41_60150 [Novipirellula artificiosorum]
MVRWRAVHTTFDSRWVDRDTNRWYRSAGSRISIKIARVLKGNRSGKLNLSNLNTHKCSCAAVRIPVRKTAKPEDANGHSLANRRTTLTPLSLDWLLGTFGK